MKQKKLEHHYENISSKLLESIYLVDVLEDLADGEGKTGTVLGIIKRDLKSAFYKVESCREVLL